jgi:hypothetical protein
VHGSCLIFTHAGKPRRVSPFLFSQFGAYNKFLLPGERELPRSGLMTRLYPFDFGYADPSNALAPYAQADCPLVVGRDILIWGITRTWSTLNPTLSAGAITPGAPGANADPALLINFVHTHNGIQRQWSNKPLTNGEIGGGYGMDDDDADLAAMFPMILHEPALLAEGDTIMCTLQNMLNATVAAQVLLLGGEFDVDRLQDEALQGSGG